MMKKQFIYMAAALLLAGCAADDLPDGQPDADGLVPIRFSSGLEVQTRAHTGMDAQFPAGRGVAFYVDNASTSAQLYGKNVLTSNGSDGFTGGEKMYFPGMDNVDIYAIHTNGTLAEAFPTAAITHTVAANQTAAADYYDSDLLYSINRGVAKTTSVVPMTFHHLLSKVRIAVKAGTAETDLAGATVQIVGTKTGAGFTPSKTADMTSAAERATMVAATGTASAITVSSDVSTDFTAGVRYNEAVVVPQSPAAGSPLFKVRLAGGEELMWNAIGGISFESGKVYTYHITVNTTGLSVSTTVADWGDGDDLPPPIQLEIVLARIPKGTFMMGSPETEPNRQSNETQHKVTLTKDFYISKYQITNAQYAIFLNAMRAKGVLNYGTAGSYDDAAYFTGTTDEPLVRNSNTQMNRKWGVMRNGDGSWSAVAGYGNHPVIYVTWYGASEFARWVGGSLPTEAQWEYACRGDYPNKATQTATLPFGIGTGKVLDGSMANFEGRYIYDYDTGGDQDLGLGNGIYANSTTAVGSYTGYANNYGLYDMHGNVREWCDDWYHVNFGNANAGDANTDPPGPISGSGRVLRGGGWDFGAQYCRSAYRYTGYPGYAFSYYGFRVAFVP